MRHARQLSRLALTALTALFLAGCQVTEDQLESFIHQNGYIVLQPPSLLYGPGSLVNRENYDPADTKPTKVMLHFLCDPRFSTALYKNAPLTSPTMTQYTVTNFSGSLSAGIPALSRLVDLNAKLKGATTITADINDVRILNFGEDDLQAIRNSLGPTCRKIVNDNAELHNAYQVTEALQATVDVTLAMNADASADAKAQVIRQLGSFGLTLSADQRVTIKGTALFFGVLLEPVLPVGKPPAVASMGATRRASKSDSQRLPVAYTLNTSEFLASAH